MSIWGTILPFVGMRRIYLNRDGSFVDTGEEDMLDERGPYYVRLLVFEWLGYGRPFWQFDGGYMRDANTHRVMRGE